MKFLYWGFVNLTMPIERKLAAIKFTDIAGYTEQMSKDEAVTIYLSNINDSEGNVLQAGFYRDLELL